MDLSLTEAELAEIEKRVNAASPGPWKSYVEGRDHTCGSSFIMRGEKGCRGEDIELTGCSVADQDFIAAARQDIPALIAEIRTLQSLLKMPNA